MHTTLSLTNYEPLQVDVKESFVRRVIRESWTYRWAIETFITNNLQRRYRRSVLGFYWGLIGPLMSMITLSIVFSVIFRTDMKAFAVYVFTGLLPWCLLSDVAIEGSQCFVGAEAYLKKVFIPKLFFPLVIVGTYTVNFLFSLFSLLIIGAFLGLQWHLSMLLLPFVVLITSVLCLGLTMLFGVATVYFRDFTHILTLTLQAFFYTLPIIYPQTAIPEQYRHWLYLNPIYYVIDLYRQVIWKGQFPPAQDWTVSIILALSVLSAGLIVLKIKEDDLIFRM